MKPTAYFLNVGRGKSVVTADLISALGRQREIAGAGLDVVDRAPARGDSRYGIGQDLIITSAVSGRHLRDGRQRTMLLRENLRRRCGRRADAGGGGYRARLTEAPGITADPVLATRLHSHVGR